jgi:S1-C subfamily serine protease
MRRRPALVLAGTLAALALSGCVASPPAAAPPPASLPDSRPTLAAESAQQHAAEITVRVRNRGCDFVATGSGFAVAENLLITNEHVVEGAEELQLDSWDGQSIPVAVHQVAYLHDLALIETVEPLPRIAKLAPGDPEPGAQIQVVGFPEGGALARSAGSVVDEVPGDRLGESGEVLRIDATVQHGNSGGPLLDDAGQVVGVVYAIEKATGYGLAIPVSALRSFIDDDSPRSTPKPCT